MTIRPAAGVAAAALLAAMLGACTSSPGSTAHTSVGATSTATPLATSIQTARGTWATVAMGHLDDPLNTFWQLLYRAPASRTWSDQSEATATATNGGLVLAAGGSTTLVGVRPSNDLTFTPLIATTNGGKSWSTGLLDEGLDSAPEALARQGGGALALATSHGGAQEVLYETGAGLSSFEPIETEPALAAGAGKSCGLTSLTSVAFSGMGVATGGRCTHSGVVGIFIDVDKKGWTITSPQLTPGSADVLGLYGTQGGGLASLIAVSDGGRTSLVAAWSVAGGIGGWTISASLALAPGAMVTSYGMDGSDGFFVLAGGHLRLISGPAGAWRQLADPPSSTATVALGPGSTIEALAVDDTVLTVWSLSLGTPGTQWSKVQTLDVPIQFGSSS